MLDIFLQISDLIAPPHPSVAILRKENTAGFLRFFTLRKIIGVFTLTDYVNPLVKAAITANKFHNQKKAAQLLAAILQHWLCSLPTVTKTILVPIPLAAGREKTRGYNQVTRVLKLINIERHEPRPLLIRHQETAPQTSLSRKQRLVNMAGVFSLAPGAIITPGWRIIIVDDVLTTGATLHAAKAALFPHLPKDCEVICVALAH